MGDEGDRFYAEHVMPGMSVRFPPFNALLGYLTGLRHFERNVYLFWAVTASRGMVIATSSTILNLYLYSLGFDARFIGVINAANSIAVLLVSVPLGYLADRLGRRPVLLAGGVAYPIGIAALALAHSTGLILAFNFILGAVSSAYWVAGVPLLVASTDERNRVQAFSVNSFLLWGLGPFGAFLGGQVVEIAGHVLGISASSAPALRVGMFFMVVLAILGALPYPFLSETARAASTPEDAQPARAMAGLFTKLLLPDLILAFGLFAILVFIQLYFHLRFHLDPGPIGLIVGVGGTVAGLGTLTVPAVARRWGNLRTAVSLQWVNVPLMAVVAVAMQLWLAIPAYWLVVALRGMIDPVYTAFIQEQVPETYRARLTGLYSVTYSIGSSLGPAASGALQKSGGFTPAFLMGAACYLAGGTLLYLFFGRRQMAVSPAVASGGE